MSGPQIHPDMPAEDLLPMLRDLRRRIDWIIYGLTQGGTETYEPIRPSTEGQ